MRASPPRGHLLHQEYPSRKGEKAGVDGGALGQKQPGQRLEMAEERARVNGSFFTNWTCGDGPETGAGGLPRYDGPERNDNGECEMVGAIPYMCHPASRRAEPGAQDRLGPEACRPLECWPATGG